MNCEQVQSLLVAYLDGEVTPSEKALIQAHLSNCTVCQQELNLLSTARSQIRATLQRRAIQAVPRRDAWSRLETRLSKMQEIFLPEAAQPSSKFRARSSRKAPSAGRAFNQRFGGVKMQKRWIFSGLAGAIILTVLTILVARNVTPVSAREVLNRAYQAQAQAAVNQGMEHIRSEIYTDIEAKGQGMETIVESYSDPVSGNFRVVTTDKASGKVLQVNAFDGSNAYSSDNLPDSQQGDVPLTVYRNPQDQNSLYLKKFTNGTDWKLNPAQDEESKFMFEKMRSDPQVELLDQETWDNTCTAPNAVRGKCGHNVYVLRSQQEIKLMVDNEITHPTGWVTFYFDTETYQLLGDRVTMERDGQEVLISSRRLVLDEILPADSNIAWDLSDLQGLNVVDDPNREHNRFGKLYQNIISVEDLASKTDSAYLLATVPEGFSLEVGVMPEQPENEQFFYEANYTSQAGDYFTIRALGKPLEDSRTDETYTTASGLVLHFIAQRGDSSQGEELTSVLIEAPNGKTYAIDSSLPRDQVKPLAEELMLVK